MAIPNSSSWPHSLQAIHVFSQSTVFLAVMTKRDVGGFPPTFPGAVVLPAVYSLLSSWRGKNCTKLTHCRQHRVHRRTGEWREAFRDGWMSWKWSGPAHGVTFTLPEKRPWCVDMGSKPIQCLFPIWKGPPPYRSNAPPEKVRKGHFQSLILSSHEFGHSQLFSCPTLFCHLWLKTAIRITVGELIPSIQDVSKGSFTQKNTERESMQACNL